MPEFNAIDLVTTVTFKASLTSEQTTDSEGKKVEGPKYSYKAEITYASVKDAVEKAAKFTTWTLQRLARNGDLPRDGSVITVNGEGEYKKSDEQIVAEMDEEQARRQYELLMARFEAKKAKK